jgi:opacity protein-like surface antigen
LAASSRRFPAAPADSFASILEAGKTANLFLNIPARNVSSEIHFKEAMLSAMVRTKFWIAFFGMCILTLAAASAQAQTDVALSIYGAFNGSTAGNYIQQSPSNSAGAMLELRHISHPLMGFDVTYSYNRDNQSYFSPVPCNPSCDPWVAVSANAHELTGDYVISFHVSNLRPFALGGVGLLLNEPASGQSNTTSSTKPVFVYGAGIDWGLLPHLGLRLQYRGNVYKAPDLTKVYTSTGAFTHSAEPMLGAYFRF